MSRVCPFTQVPCTSGCLGGLICIERLQSIIDRTPKPVPKPFPMGQDTVMCSFGCQEHGRPRTRPCSMQDCPLEQTRRKLSIDKK